jgi:hypothetical protein
VSELFDTFVCVVHGETDTSLTFKFVDLGSLFSTVCTSKDDFEGAWFIDDEVSSFVLVSEGVSAYNDGFFPSGDEFGYVFDDDGLSEDGAVEDVSNGAIGAFPHGFEMELLDSNFIRGDGGAFDANFAVLNGVCGLEGDLVVGVVSVLYGEVEVEYGEVEEGGDEFLFDVFPDDSGHFVAIEFCDGVGDLNFSGFHLRYKYILV